LVRDKSKAFVRIICDGANKFGFGNLRRSSTLGAAFKSRGYQVSVDALSENARRVLPASPVDVGEPDVWLLDLPYNGDRWVNEARQKGKPVVALDYEGMVSPDLTISIFHRRVAPENVRQLVGLEYVIIRSEIRTLRPAESGHGAIIIIGGGDQDGIGEDAAVKVNDLGIPVTLIEGPLAEMRKKLPPQVVRLKNPVDLPARMASSGWGVTSGGGAMFEMLFLGKPVHVVPRTLFEESLASLLAANGVLLGIGLENLRLPPANLCVEVSAKGRALIDGKGVDRIINAVEALL
jgi:spore coat polysaccharide biosynthesis predicted glycosyltransferase SpsG